MDETEKLLNDCLPYIQGILRDMLAGKPLERSPGLHALAEEAVRYADPMTIGQWASKLAGEAAQATD